MRLTAAEIAETKARRAENIRLRGKATVPTEPWPKVGTSSLAEVATRAMHGSYNVSDIRFMAMALLQMQDMVCELKERVRQIESKTPTV
jgi:hypothetical protein